MFFAFLIYVSSLLLENIDIKEQKVNLSVPISTVNDIIEVEEEYFSDSCCAYDVYPVFLNIGKFKIIVAWKRVSFFSEIKIESNGYKDYCSMTNKNYFNLDDKLRSSQFVNLVAKKDLFPVNLDEKYHSIYLYEFGNIVKERKMWDMKVWKTYTHNIILYFPHKFIEPMIFSEKSSAIIRRMVKEGNKEKALRMALNNEMEYYHDFIMKNCEIENLDFEDNINLK